MTTALSLRSGDRVPDFALPGLDGKLRKLIWSFTGEPVALLVIDDLRTLDGEQFASLLGTLQGLPPPCPSSFAATPLPPRRPFGPSSMAKATARCCFATANESSFPPCSPRAAWRSAPAAACASA